MEVLMHEAATQCDTLNNSNSKNFRENEEQYGTTAQNTNYDLAKFSRVPTRSPIDITFQDIVYNASLGFKKGTKKIINGISGRFPPGQLIAIMGPSGAGKSTLLDILSGYRKTDIQGKVYINGEERDLRSFRKISCYITQDDRLQPLLTIKENMMAAADLKLPTDVTAREKSRIIHEILIVLGLVKSKGTLAKELSGGQKKRLSIALELINNPIVMFLDEPTTGLDSLSCSQCIKLLKLLACQGRTIVCTIHQPSASLFQIFDQVYVLSEGNCLYQGSTDNIVQFFDDVGAPCPMYHNPADYAIEVACGEYGKEIIARIKHAMENGRTFRYFKNPDRLPSLSTMKDRTELEYDFDEEDGFEVTSQFNQLKVLLRRGWIKMKRDRTLTYMRIFVNIIVGLMLGTLYWQSGGDASKTMDNYNLLFSIIMHNVFSTMMLTILTFPSEMTILIKEHFNRWYSLKVYYISITLIDIPITVLCGTIFSAEVYYMTGQPLEIDRFIMFLAMNLLITFVAQSFGLMIGAVFDVVNGCFVGPILNIPMMMFAGFGVRLNDIPTFLYWGTYISYLRYGLEGVVGAIYGSHRNKLECPEEADYCMHAIPSRFLQEIQLRGDQFWNDVIALVLFILVLKLLAYALLRVKMTIIR